MMEEFFGEYPAMQALEPSRGDGGTFCYVSGNYVAEPGVYTCVTCEEALAPPLALLKPGERVPDCLHCGPRARWVRR